MNIFAQNIFHAVTGDRRALGKYLATCTKQWTQDQQSPPPPHLCCPASQGWVSWAELVQRDDMSRPRETALAHISVGMHHQTLLFVAARSNESFQNHPFCVVIKDLTLMNSLSIHSVAWLSSSSTSAPCPWWSRAAIQSIKNETSCSSSTINDGCFMWGQKLREIHTDRQTESWEM